MLKTFLVVFTLMSCYLASSKVNAQSFLGNGKIPTDLSIKFGTYGQQIHEYRVTSNGSVFFKYENVMLVQTIHLGDKQSEKPKLEDKLSELQLKHILNEFERTDFFKMNDNYQGNPNLTNVICINHSVTKSISISANGKTKTVSYYLGCEYSDFPPFENFTMLYNFIGKELTDVQQNPLDEQTQRIINHKKRI